MQHLRILYSTPIKLWSTIKKSDVFHVHDILVITDTCVRHLHYARDIAKNKQHPIHISL